METFKKREKEMRRLDRQKQKAARRMQRKQDRAASAGDTSSGDTSSDDTPKVEQDSAPAAEPNTDV
jgi:hypothetical protein